MAGCLPDRLTWIDETNRGVHHFIGSPDRCLFFGEFFGGETYEAGETNQLIKNFKITPTELRQNPYRQRYKDGACATIAKTLSATFSGNQSALYTWVPIPSSKLPDHVDYDPRLPRVLQQAFGQRNDCDIRELIKQSKSTEADHVLGENRSSMDELEQVATLDLEEINRSAIRENGIILFDDMLTSGKHFRCYSDLLQSHFSDVSIMGVFVARRIFRHDPNATPFQDIDW